MSKIIPLHDYQKIAKDFLINTPKAGLFLDVGFGKTATTLAALLELAQCGKLHGHILVVAPKAIARSTWIDEMEKWGINANVVSLIVNSKGKQLSRQQRLALYEDISAHPPAFYFIGREMICDLVNWHIENKRPWPFPTMIIDELQSFKSHTTNRFKAVKKIMPFVKRFIGLTGTPIPNGLMDLWAEIYLMDQGKRLGKTITAYRSSFFYPKRVINNITVEWGLKSGADTDIYNRINDVVISIKNPSIKLPPITYNDIKCYMTSDESKAYKMLLKTKVLDTFTNNGRPVVVEASNAAVLSAKLRQMASGTLYADEQHNYAIIHKHKLEQLHHIITNTSSPILIAYHFKSDEIEIKNYLESQDITVTKFDGSPEMIHSWNRGEIPVLLLQPQSCGHGLNLQDGGHTIVWYTIPVSLELYIQLNGRLYRQGQKYPVMIHHLITQNTIDTRLLQNLANKDRSEKALIDAVAASLSDVK